jgi:DNA ligase-1
MNESNMEHGIDWTGQNPAGWNLSEKFNGCRAYWDGREMWSRGGLRVKLPSSWREALPVDVHLDGEIYDNPGGVFRCGAAVRYGRFTPSMRFMVFDAPTMPGYWPERMQRAAVSLTEGTVARCVEYRMCTGLADAVQEFYRIKELHGEGLMLRAPDHRYAARRTAKLLKFKDSALIALCSMAA